MRELSFVPRVISLKLSLAHSEFRKSQEGLDESQSCDADFADVDSPRRNTRFDSPRKHPRNARGSISRGRTGYHV